MLPHSGAGVGTAEATGALVLSPSWQATATQSLSRPPVWKERAPSPSQRRQTRVRGLPSPT